MKIFAFDPAEHRGTYDTQGWVHIPGGVHPDFLDLLQERTRLMRQQAALHGQGLAGAKEQYLFDFPPQSDFPAEFFQVVAGITGLDATALTLSERHIKVYDDDADPEPQPHKDRYASQVAMGLSIDVPAGSNLVLYPDDAREVNPYLSTDFRANLPPERQPDVALRGAREVAIADSPGDVMIFPGSSTWHLRRRSAGATNLYLKVNDFGSDPLAEDPSTPLRREQTERLLVAGDLTASTPRLSRRYDSAVRTVRRDGSEELVGVVWGRPPVPLSEDDLILLRAADGRRTADELGQDRVRRLAEAGVLDL